MSPFHSIAFINGSRAGALSVTSDGVPNVDTGNQQGPTLLPALESIGEIKVLLTNYQAEYGRNYGGSITTVTKAGTKHSLRQPLESHGEAQPEGRFLLRADVP